MRHALGIVLVLGLIFGTASPSAAQTNGNGKLSTLVGDLYIENFVADVLILDRVFPGALDRLLAGDLDENDPLFRFFAPAAAMNQLIATQLTSFPVGSSAGGFSWTFDPVLGTFSRVSSSFGSSFVERGLTVGRRKLNFGMTYQRATFDKIEGVSLRNGDIKVYAGLTCLDLGLVCDDAFFFEESLDLKLSTSTVGMFGSYGLTDRLDIGVAVPIVAVEMDAALTTRVGTKQGGLFPDNAPFVDRRSGDASGIGDVVIRGKYRLWDFPGGGLAAGVDWRLPTGDEEDLLGVAGAQGKFFVAISGGQGRVSPHANLGFTISGDTEAGRSEDTFLGPPPDEFNYSAGLDIAATPRLTLTGDIIGRNLRNTGGLLNVASSFRPGFTEFAIRDGNLNVALGAVSVKYNPFGRALLAANFLVPLNATGLYDQLTWALGFEYSF